MSLTAPLFSSRNHYFPPSSILSNRRTIIGFSPTKIENFILSIDGVKDVVVYGRENSITGNIVVANIVCDVDKSAIKFEIKNTDKLLEHEKPLQIKFVNSLELTDTGKVKRIWKQSY